MVILPNPLFEGIVSPAVPTSVPEMLFNYSRGEHLVHEESIAPWERTEYAADVARDETCREKAVTRYLLSTDSKHTYHEREALAFERRCLGLVELSVSVSADQPVT